MSSNIGGRSLSPRPAPRTKTWRDDPIVRTLKLWGRIVIDDHDAYDKRLLRCLRCSTHWAAILDESDPVRPHYAGPQGMYWECPRGCNSRVRRVWARGDVEAIEALDACAPWPIPPEVRERARAAAMLPSAASASNPGGILTTTKPVQKGGPTPGSQVPTHHDLPATLRPRDLAIVTRWRGGMSAAAIAECLGDVVTHTVENRIGVLRKIHGPDVVPSDNARKAIRSGRKT